MNKVSSFEDLVCWQKARQLKVKMYRLTKRLPAFEQYDLNSQIRRASVSMTANIAEGYGRYNYTEKIQFNRYSRASVLEVQDHLYTCLDAEYICRKEFDSLYQEASEAAKSINGYMGYLAEQRRKGRCAD